SVLTVDGEFGALDGEPATLLDRPPDRRVQLALELVRRVVTAAFAGQQLLERLVDAVLLQAWRAVLDVPAQLGVAPGAAFGVQQQEDLGQRLVAAHLVLGGLGVHRATSCASPRMKPRSRATPAPMFSC